jgi:hypothetical protein
MTMHNTEAAKAAYANHAIKIPPSMSYDIDDFIGARTGKTESLVIKVHCYTQDKVRELRRAFPGIVWRKTRRDSIGWWEYKAQLDDTTTIKVVGCTEAPPTCRQVTEEVEVTEKVPVEFTEEMQPVKVPTRYEDRTVTKTVTRWVCDESKETIPA